MVHADNSEQAATNHTKPGKYRQHGPRAHGRARVRFGTGQGAATSRGDYSRFRARGTPYGSRRGLIAHVDPHTGMTLGMMTLTAFLRRFTGKR